MYRIHLIHWNAQEAIACVDVLQNAGFSVAFEPFSQSVLKELSNKPPDAIVIDLGRLPSQGRDIAVGLRTRKATRHVPLIFIGGRLDKVTRVKETLPDAAFMDWDRIGDDLLPAIQNAPADPVVPESLFAGYAGTPLPKKLGIKADTAVALINAPQGFEETLGELPKGATLDRTDYENTDLTLWFVVSRKELENDVRNLGASAGSGGLWIIWPKRSSGVSSDLTQNTVRKTGLASGLVDYKVASIDQVWSGLRFTRRKG